jgi:hypothetical protein
VLRKREKVIAENSCCRLTEVDAGETKPQLKKGINHQKKAGCMIVLFVTLNLLQQLPPCYLLKGTKESNIKQPAPGVIILVQFNNKVS